MGCKGFYWFSSVFLFISYLIRKPGKKKDIEEECTLFDIIMKFITL